MDKVELKKRTKKFAISVLKFVERIPKTKAGSVIEYQLTKSGTSVVANYRSACRSRSDKDFSSRITICEEEADECCYWLELLVESEMTSREEVKELWKEANELTAIFAASGKTMKKKLIKLKSNPKSEIRNPK